MIYTVYHHTAYNYSKFTPRHKELYANANLVSPCCGLKLSRLQLHKALKMSTLFCDFSPRRALGLAYAGVKVVKAATTKPNVNNLSTFNQGLGFKAKDVFFKTKPLLCWRSDLAYFNLRWYFLNTFKALHLCWNAVKNNKRIAFVGVDSDRLTFATNRTCRRLEQTTAFYRDVVPRLKQRTKRHKKQRYNRLTLTKTTFISRFDNPIKDKKPSYNHNLNARFSLDVRLYGLTRLIRACHGLRSHHAEPKQPRLGPLLKQQHRLQSLCAQTFVKLPVVAYPTAGTGFLSNPAHPLKAVFNHFATACTNLKPSDLNQHLKCIPGALRSHAAVAKYCILQFNHIGLTPNISFQYYDSHTYKLKPIKPHLNEALLNEVCQGTSSGGASGKFLREPVKQASTLCLGQTSGTYSTNDNQTLSVANLRHFVYKSRLCQAHMKALVVPSYSAKGLVKDQKWVSCVKPRRMPVGFSSKSKSPLFSSYGQRSSGRRQTWHKNNNVAKYMMSAELKGFQNWAVNPHLKQAGVIFFANPDKYTALAAQAKRLRIPTIGLVSGLQHQNQYGSKKHLKQNDSVDYPILGNPDNSFFVLIIVRMFMSVVRKAASSSKHSARPIN